MSLSHLSRDFISRCISDQGAYAVLRSLCEDIGPRPSGSEGERRATDYVAGLIAEAGLRTDVAEFTYSGWERGPTEASVRVNGSVTPVPCFPLGWCPPGAVSAPIVDVGCGSEEEFRRHEVGGRIALVSSATARNTQPLHRSRKYELAEQAGAAGFAFYTDKPGGLPVMGSARLSAQGVGSIPGVGIPYEDAMFIRRAGTAASMTVSSRCRSIDAVSSNCVGVKPGVSGGEIVVCGHIDSWFSPGAVDNGSGIAMVVELARLLRRYELGRSVRFITFGSEELGLLGSRAYIERNPDVSGIAALLNLDCSAIKDGHLTIATNDNAGLHEFVRELVGLLHLSVDLRDERTRYSDHDTFRERGTPCAAFLSSSPGYGFGHTACDTLDKVEPESFTIPLLVAGVTIIECATQDGLFFAGGDGEDRKR